MRALVAAILGVWFGLSCINQLGAGRGVWRRRISSAITRYDRCFLIPDFRYFAPDPPAFDLELLYRDRLHDGALTPWRAVELSASTWWRRVWNPGKRRYEVASDWCLRLLQRARADAGGWSSTSDTIYASMEYIGLATYVSAAAHSVDGVETQFLIAVSPGFETSKAPAIAFVSPLFALS